MNKIGSFIVKIGSSMPNWLKLIVAIGVLVFAVSQIFYNFSHSNDFFGWVAVGFSIFNFAYIIYLVVRMIVDKYSTYRRSK